MGGRSGSGAWPWFGIRLALWLACSLATPSALAYPLERGEWEDVQKFSLQLAKEYPPKTSSYLFVGRSLGTVATYLRMLNEGLVHELPLSRFRYQIEGVSGNRDMAVTRPQDRPHYRSLTDEERTKIFTHFDATIPTDAQLGGRELVLLDYGNGDSLHAAAVYLREYFKERKRTTKIKTVLFHHATRYKEGQDDAFNQARFDRLIDSNPFRALRSTAYAEMPELYSRIGGWYLERDKPGMVLNPVFDRYQEMRAELSKMHTASKDGSLLEDLLGRCAGPLSQVGKAK